MTAAERRPVEVVALGELVVDLIPAGRDGDEPLYAARPGGAPGNVAAGLSRLGVGAAMLTKVGRDGFGQLAVAALAATGVDVASIREAETGNTALACVSPDGSGDHSFALYRSGCADSVYAAEEVDAGLIRGAKVLHVGSLWLKTPISAAAQRRAVALAREAGVLVSADPNLRPAVWDDRDAMAAAGREAVASADVVKMSEEELALLAGTGQRDEALRRLWHPRLRVVAVTRGAHGAILRSRQSSADVPGFPVEVADTVGCGDAFMASLIAGLVRHGADRLDAGVLRDIGVRASAAGAIVATRAGAMARMPRRDEIEAFLSERSRGREP